MNNDAEVLIKFKGDTTDVDKATESFGKLTTAFTLGNIASKAVSTAIGVINSNLDAAISRVDTMNNFPKVMDNLGISAKESEKAIQKVSDALVGLPTTIDEAALSIQRFTSKNGDVQKSADLFLAVNNAILAGGASPTIQASALEQLSQAYAKGKPDMMEWRSIQTAMPAQLKQVAKAMGYVDAATLGEAVRAKNGEKVFSKMMDTMMKMNKEGVGGFKSFEEQAKNATGGIQTSIKNMKTAFVRGMADVIKQVDKALESFGGIKGVLNTVGKIGEKVFKKLGNVVSKTITCFIEFGKWINKNREWLIPLISTIATFIATFKTIITVKTAITKVSSAYGGLMKLLSTNSTTVAIAAIAGLGIALGNLLTKTDQVEKKHKEEMDSLKKVSDEINNQRKAWNQLKDEKQNDINVGMTQLSHEQALYNELKNITDENGKIKKGYEARASFITSELANSLGIEIELSGGIIKNYQQIQKEIDKLIEKKKAQILLEAQEELYAEAIKKKAKAQQDLTKAEETLNKKSKTRNELEDKYNEYIKKSVSAYKQGKEEDANRYAYNALMTKRRLDLADEEYKKAQTNYNKQQDLVNEYYYNIGQYEKNAELFHKGQYKKMTNVNWDYVKDFQSVEDSQKKILDKQIKDEENTLGYLKQLKAQTGSDIYDQQIKDSEAQLKAYKEELKKYETTATQSQEQTKKDWQKTIATQLSAISGQKIEFKKAGDGMVQAYVDGVKVGEPTAESEMEKLATEVVKKAKNKKSDAKQAGINIVNGLKEGIQDKNTQDKLTAAAKKIANKTVNVMKNILGIHSPSTVMAKVGINLLEGFNNGILKEQRNVLKATDNFANKVLDNMAFNKTISGTVNTCINPYSSPSNSMLGVMNNSRQKQVINVYANFKQDNLGQVVRDIKTFSGGARNDFNYGVGA